MKVKDSTVEMCYTDTRLHIPYGLCLRGEETRLDLKAAVWPKGEELEMDETFPPVYFGPRVSGRRFWNSSFPEMAGVSTTVRS